MDNSKKSCIDIREEYKNYAPPINATAVIQELINHIPEKYLTGLNHIFLTNFSGQPGKRRHEKIKSRKRKVKVSDSYGMYHSNPKGQANKAWIEIFADNILNECPKELLKNPFFSDLIFAKTLYHEIGHHIHRTMRPWRREDPENIADEWRDKFTRSFIKEKYSPEKLKTYSIEVQESLEKIFGKENLEEMAKQENYNFNFTKI